MCNSSQFIIETLTCMIGFYIIIEIYPYFGDLLLEEEGWGGGE